MLENESILEKILDEVNEGVHVIDEQGNSILYNRKMEEIEAMNREDVLQKNITDVFQFQSDQDSTLLHCNIGSENTESKERRSITT
ncbi:PAS domain S-box protein [Ammoniphilus sp. 3BR4]|uniref:PAS domain S-box protein n=1 Tax=Ammoniphilus sp. 3BR4 TaxID=3158265 RepID=UPI003466A055